MERATTLPTEAIYRVNDAPIAGVCGGIARWGDMDPTVVRVLAVVLAVLTCGLVAFLYLALWLLLPKEADSLVTVDVSPGSTAAKTTRASRPTIDKRSFVVLLALAIGLALIAGAGTLILVQAAPDFPPLGFFALLAVAVGIARLAVPGPEGYTFLSIIEGSALFFVGILTMLALLDVVSLRVDSWFAQNWPFLLISFGMFLQARAIESRLLAVCAFLAVVVFCTIGILFYVDLGPQIGRLGMGPAGTSMLPGEGFFHG